MARSFNGSTDKILASSIGSTLLPQNTTAQFTISCWVFTTSTAGVQAALVISNAGSSYSCAMGTSTTSWRASNHFTDNSDHNIIGGSVSTSTWTHLLMTLASSGQLVTFYVGGSSIGTTNVGQQWGRTASTDSVVRFGEDDADGFTRWSGNLAEFAVWANTVLSAGEITALANGARPYTVRPAGLTGYWPLTGLQSPEPDFSGNANNGTITGTANASGPPLMEFTPRWPQFLTQPSAFNPAWAIGRNQFIEGFAS